MAYLVASGHLVDVILVLTVVEWVGLTLYHRRTGRGPDALQIGSNVLSGVFLLVALRAALAGAAWTWIALALTAALFAHVADLAQRWR